MKLPRLQMGCLSSRSTIVPSERVENNNNNTNIKTKIKTGQETKLPTTNKRPPQTQRTNGKTSPNERILSNGISNYIDDANEKEQKPDKQSLANSSTEVVDDDIMSILMNQDNQDKSGDQERNMKLEDTNYKASRSRRPLAKDGSGGSAENRSQMEIVSDSNNNKSLDGIEKEDGKEGNGEDSFEEEPNQDLLRQYIAIDYEITLLEDKDALRVYHEKIEQLEQLERELDMISSEVEEVAARSETGTQLERDQSVGGGGGQAGGGGVDPKMDIESNSIISGATGSISRKSWMPTSNVNNNQRSISGHNAQTGKNDQMMINQSQPLAGGKKMNNNGGSATGSSRLLGSSSRHFNNNNNNLSYSTVEEVFNRKIILEKERDKLKKEVEMVIIECDKLQQRYKKRDEILDKLFDGRTGNGLENHLEQQLNWLLEQKHYVDQVFYAWKRAETLTSQTCEQFTNALELLKRLPQVENPNERSELVKSISDLLIKSRQDIEQAQQYNPNVDAPFFTDNETERFDTIIESISSNSISQSEYSQVLTVIQFAYKRAVSIRLWLEQILQTTIARDSFELAEEYKWIAIQLRKERINLIKSKLQSPAYQPMVQSIQEQMARQQQTMSDQRRQHEINRDSGIESETNDIDIEEEIYRLLELNRSRLEITTSGAATSGSSNNMANASASATGLISKHQQQHDFNNKSDQNQQHQKLKVTTTNSHQNEQINNNNNNNKDQKMRERIQKRVKGDQPLLTTRMSNGAMVPPSSGALSNQQDEACGNSTAAAAAATTIAAEAQSNDVNLSIGTPTRLKIELDEEAKQSLLKQVGQVHLQHKSKIEKLRGNNRAKAANLLMNRMQQVRETNTGRDTATSELNGSGSGSGSR